MQAYLYGRWSTLEQTKGSTLDRQLHNTQTDASANGWTVAETIIDEGRSAYTGANIETGNLGRFAKRILSGEIDAREAVLVVEELDRLSRQPAPVMLGWLTPLLAKGLTVRVTQTGKVITMDLLSNDMGGFLTVMMEAFGSHKESKKKSERLVGAWDKKRRAVAAGERVAVNHRHPQWVEIIDGAWKLHPLRARLVREIFALHLDGHGKGAIAKLFNERRLSDPDYDTWPLKNVKAALWTATYIGRILHNRSTLGWWQPHRSPRGGTRTPTGKPVLLYPPVIDDETFNRANDTRHVNQMKHQGKGRNLSNLLGTKARCAKCGGKMDALGSARYRTNRDGSKTRHYFLYCHNAKVAKTCDHARGWTYDRIEKPILDHLLARAMDDQFFSNDNDVTHVHEQEVFRLRRLVEEQTAGVKVALKIARGAPNDDLLADETAAAAAELRETKGELEKAEARLSAARGKVSPAEHVRRVEEVRDLMESGDENERYQARVRVKAALQSIITKIDFDDARALVSVDIVGGIGLLLIRKDDTVWDVNLHKPGRDYTFFKPEVQATMAGYLRRSAAC